MILPDVNVLLYAFRADLPDHAACRNWVQAVVDGETAYGMSAQVLCSVVRIATHPRIFAQPSRLDEVTAFVRALRDQPHCQAIEPGPRHWGIFLDVCRQAKATGNLVQDAWFAALAIESGCEWITMDCDYSRFSGLRCRAPF